MRTCRERIVKIRQMQEAGASLANIASTFGTSVQAVRLVFGKLKADEEAVRRSGELLEEFRRADDLDKRWKVMDLLEALLLTTRARTAIENWCEWNNAAEFSLREFMDLVISEKPHARPGFLITPLLDFHNVRLKIFWSTVKRVTEADFGERCNQEWRSRLARLKQATRIVGGGYCSWSKACEHPDWLLRPDMTKMDIRTEASPAENEARRLARK